MPTTPAAPVVPRRNTSVRSPGVNCDIPNTVIEMSPTVPPGCTTVMCDAGFAPPFQLSTTDSSMVVKIFLCDWSHADCTLSTSATAMWSARFVSRWCQRQHQRRVARARDRAPRTQR